MYFPTSQDEYSSTPFFLNYSKSNLFEGEESDSQIAYDLFNGKCSKVSYRSAIEEFDDCDVVLKKKSKKRTNTGVESKNRNISKASRVSEQSSIGSEGFDIQINQIENVSVAKEHYSDNQQKMFKMSAIGAKKYTKFSFELPTKKNMLKGSSCYNNNLQRSSHHYKNDFFQIQTDFVQNNNYTYQYSSTYKHVFYLRKALISFGEYDPYLEPEKGKFSYKNKSKLPTHDNKQPLMPTIEYIKHKTKNYLMHSPLKNADKDMTNNTVAKSTLEPPNDKLALVAKPSWTAKIELPEYYRKEGFKLNINLRATRGFNQLKKYVFPEPIPEPKYSPIKELTAIKESVEKVNLKSNDSTKYTENKPDLKVSSMKHLTLKEYLYKRQQYSLKSIDFKSTSRALALKPLFSKGNTKLYNRFTSSKIYEPYKHDFYNQPLSNKIFLSSYAFSDGDIRTAPRFSKPKQPEDHYLTLRKPSQCHPLINYFTYIEQLYNYFNNIKISYHYIRYLNREMNIMANILNDTLHHTLRL